MSFREKLRKFKSDTKSRIFQSNQGTSVDNVAGQATASVSGTPHNWAYLRLLLGSLDQAARPFAPLKAAVAELVGCIDTFEGVLHGRKEYEDLYNELEGLFQVLHSHCTQNVPPAITATVESLCHSLQNEAAHIRHIQDKRKLRQYLEAGQDAEEVLACYRRIQRCLQRTSLNTDMSIWRVLDDIATVNRLKHLSPSLSARYNSAQAVELKRGPCTEGTRVDLLAQMITWADSSDSGSVYWMSGMAGTGKTTIAYSLCLELEAKRYLAASFFCSRLLPECRDVNLIIPSIAYQLARLSHPFRFVLSGVLEKDPDVHTQLQHIQFNALIAQPLLEVKETLSDILVVVIDALDECENKESTSQILDVLLTRAPELPVKFVVSSRPEPEMRDELTKHNDQVGSRVVLHELDKHTVRVDIETYLRATLASIQPTDDQIATLVERSGILFIYAATVVRYIGYDKFRRNPLGRLANILESSTRSENQHKEIDQLYATILRAALHDESLDDREREDMQQVLYTVICAHEPLTVKMLSELLQIRNTNRIHAALRPLWSVLHISGASELVTTLHASFPDYMLDLTRSKSYYCNARTHHQIISRYCFDCFGGIDPQFNICGLESSYVPDDEVEGLEERIQAVISPELFYAARYWAKHLHSAAGSSDLIQRLEEFLTMRLLLWMEVMNLKKCSEMMPRLIRLVEIWDVEWPEHLSTLIHDAWRFVSTFALGAASNSTSHIYVSMLPFWPGFSPITKCYTRRTRGFVKTEGTAINQREHALLATWLFDDTPIAPTFSPDGTLIAVGVWSKIYLLNSSTGRPVLPPFEGDGPYISTVQFSPDGCRIAGVSVNTLSVWNTQNGKMTLGPVKGSAGSSILQVAFSPDGARIVLLSWRASVYIWDAFSGECITGPLEFDYGHRVLPLIKYTPDGRYIVFGSAKGVLVCDVQGEQSPRLVGSYNASNRCTSFDISPDGARIASGCNQNNIRIYDTKTGELVLGPLNITTSTMHGCVQSVSFSSKGLHLVSCSADGIYTWDTRNGNLLLGPLGKQTNRKSAQLSFDGAYIISVSEDSALHLWDAHSAHASPDPLRGPTNSIQSIGYTPDGAQIISVTRIASPFETQITCVWDAVSGEMVFEPIEQRNYGIMPLAFSPRGCRYITSLADGRRLVLLDTQTGSPTLSPLSNPCYAVGSVAVSPNEKYALIVEDETWKHKTHPLRSSHPTSSDSQRYIVRVLSVDTGQALMVIHLPPFKDGIHVPPVALFSSDGNHIIVCSKHETASDHVVYVYDAHSGRLLHDQLRSIIPSFRISSDGTRVVSFMYARGLVHDVRSGEAILQLSGGHTKQVESVAFSLDGTRIISGASDHGICIWDAQTGQRIIGPSKWHTGVIRAVGFSPDGKRVVSGSDDKVIRVTDIQTAEISDPSLPRIGEWLLREDGWIVDKLSRLLVWVPFDLRTVLMWPRTKLLISTQGYLRLDFDGAYIGEFWAKCYQPSG